MEIDNALTRCPFSKRHQALARATLEHDSARGALRAAGYSDATKRRPRKYWLCAYYEAAEAEDACAQLVPVRQEDLIEWAGADGVRLEVIAEAASLRAVVANLLASLTPQEERILRMRFFHEQTLEESALALGLKRERIRALEALALRKLAHVSRSRKWRHILGIEPRPRERAPEIWTPRGLGAHAAMHERATPTWARFALLSAGSRGAPVGLAGAVKKLEGAWSKADFERLTALFAAGGPGAKTLRHARVILPSFTSVLAALPAPLRLERIAALLNPAQAELVARAAARIGGPDERGVMRRLCERVSRARSTPQLFQMLVAEISAWSGAGAPDVAAPWLCPLTSVQALERAAIRFRNCLRGHIPRLLAGDAAYFEALDPSPAIVQIVRGFGGRWCLGEVAGPRNGPIGAALRARLTAHLSAHKIHTRRIESDALALLLWREARRA